MIRPPRLATTLLRFALPNDTRGRSIAGDLLQEYEEKADSASRVYLWLWYWGQSLALGARYLVFRCREPRAGNDGRRSASTDPTIVVCPLTREEAMENFWTDLRYGVRMLFRTPTLSLVSILTIGLGIGLVTFSFSVVYGSVLRPMPVQDPERLVVIEGVEPATGDWGMYWPMADYVEFRDQTTVFESLAAGYTGTINITGEDGPPERFDGAFLTANGLEILGVPPHLGRTFQPGEDRPEAEGTLVIGYDVWRNRFGGDASVIGRRVRANGEGMTIIGVMPPGFRFPFDQEVWLPYRADWQGVPRGQGNVFQPYGHLREDVTIEAAREEVEMIAGRLAEEFPGTNEGITADVERFQEIHMPAEITAVLWLMLGATFGVMLIACANVANLLLTRAAAREHELGVRIAQGAPASTLVLETLARCAWLSLLGATAGLLVAWLALGALARLGPTDLPRLDQVRVDGGVFLFALGLVILVTVAAGLAPALRALRVDPAQVLMRAGSRSRSGSAFRRPGAQLLLVAQVALSLVLLVASGLLLRSLLHLRATDPGFEPAGAFSFRVSLAGDRYREPTARVELFRLLWERLRALPEVAAGGGTTLLPLTRGYAWTDFVLEGQGAPDGRDRVVADVSTVSEGYFSAMGIPLLAGRRFSAADGLEPLSVIVDRTLAERHWGVDEAVGRWIDNDLIGRATVVGVVDSVLHYGLDAEPRMTVFYPYPARAARSLYGVLRTADGDSDPAALRDAVVAAVRELDPELAVHDTRTLRQRVGASLARQRLLTWLLAAFAVVALTLATIGLYGLLAYAVGTETRSIGIRRTFGAQERDLYRLVLGAAGRIVLWGLALGLAVTFLAGRAIAGLLFRVETGDLVTHVGALLLLASVAAIAALAPARRAARIEPLDALRSE